VRARRGLGAGLAAFALAACGGGAPSPFAYDADAPLAFRDRGVVNAPYPIAIHDVSFASEGGKVDALLAVPPGRGPFPAVIYLHGAGGNRLEWIGPATWLAAHRAIGLTVSFPWERRPSLKPAAGLRLGVIEVRRAVDLLVSRADVDASRIGLVGFSLGARLAALVSGAEPRIGSVVILGGGAAGTPYDEAAAVRRSHAAFLIQIGRHDEVVPATALDALARAAPKADVRRYDTGHTPTVQEERDQISWLSAQLGLHAPPVRGAVTGP
jgi:dienelactone hydrolase